MRFQHMFFLLILLIILTILLTRQTPLPTSSPKAPFPGPSTVLGTQSVVLTPSQCHEQDGLPDPTCTPGVIDSRVTQDNIASTICMRGYTKTVRPPVEYTQQLKKQQIVAYGYSDTNPKDYEEDHLISLELGGNPTDPKNLWPEPGASPNEKDSVENRCNEKVCTGAMSLQDAQAQIAKNWKTACQ